MVEVSVLWSWTYTVLQCSFGRFHALMHREFGGLLPVVEDFHQKIL